MKLEKERFVAFYASNYVGLHCSEQIGVEQSGAEKKENVIECRRSEKNERRLETLGRTIDCPMNIVSWESND